MNKAIITELENLKGLTGNPEYFIRLKRRLSGNIAMDGIDDFQLSQISWEAKDLIIDDIILLLSTKE